MTTVELEPGTIETVDDEPTDDNEHKFCHLYQSGWFESKHTLCGLPIAQDWHQAFHHSLEWKKGMMSCPTCGAPICMDCLLQAS